MKLDIMEESTLNLEKTTIGTLIAAVLCMNDKTTNDSAITRWFIIMYFKLDISK